MYDGERDSGGCHDDTSTLFLEFLRVQPLGHEETEEQLVEHHGDDDVEQNGRESIDDPAPAPLRIAVAAHVVLLVNRIRHRAPSSAEILKQGGVAVATINKDVALNLAVTLVGILIQVAQSAFCLVVVANVALQLQLTLHQHVANVLGQYQTGVATLGAILRGHHLRQSLQPYYQAVVACQLNLVSL